MKIKKLKQIVKEEILIHKYGGISLVNEEVTNEDEDKIRKIIRQEVSAIFFEHNSPMFIEFTFTFNDESFNLLPLQASQVLVLIKLSIHLLMP